MATTNLLNVSSVKGNFSAQAESSKRLQEETNEVAEVFASMMNQTIDISNQLADDVSSEMDISKTKVSPSVADSYDRYSYKDNQIKSARETSVAEKVDEAKETLEQVEEEIVNTISEEYAVEEDAMYDLLEEMGLSVLDLLNPQNLVSFLTELTGVSSGEELLLDGNFLRVMEALDQMSQGLMKELGVNAEGLYEIIGQMDMVEQNQEMTDSFADVLDVAKNLETADLPLDEKENSIHTDDAVDVQDELLVQNGQNVQDGEEVVNATDELMTEEVDGVKVQVEVSDETTETLTQETKGLETQDADDDSSFAGNQNRESDSLLSHNSNETVMASQTTTLGGQVEQVQNTQFSSYLSVDTVQIMEQIVEQMRVNITPEKTSMEMQINPENLGKVFVHISAEEGVVNAQFAATNEVVKEALEAQIATLKESLNQAGVKVDAIEVTIASHEFERNLEQNQKQSDEELSAQEGKTNKRRNLSIDSLDELSGVMTEEEAIVAQIMKDNGNSIDLTA